MFTPGNSSIGKPRQGSGRNGLRHKRSKISINGTIEGISKGDIRRLARRAGIKRIGLGCYGNIRTLLREYLSMIVKDVSVLAEYRCRMTITVQDILLALKRRGRTLYGFGEITNLTAFERGQSLRKPISTKRVAMHYQRLKGAAVPESPQPAGTPASPMETPMSSGGPESTPMRTAETPSNEPETPMTDERISELQAAISHYACYVSPRLAANPITKIEDLEAWVVKHLQSKRQAPCGTWELSSVLHVLQEENKLQLSDVDPVEGQSVYFL